MMYTRRNDDGSLSERVSVDIMIGDKFFKTWRGWIKLSSSSYAKYYISECILKETLIERYPSLEGKDFRVEFN